MKYFIKVFLVFLIIVGSTLTTKQPNINAEEKDTNWQKLKIVENFVLAYQLIMHRWNLKRMQMEN